MVAMHREGEGDYSIAGSSHLIMQVRLSSVHRPSSRHYAIRIYLTHALRVSSSEIRNRPAKKAPQCPTVSTGILS